MRILIADSGSTKTEWKVIENGNQRESLFTPGLNPYFVTEEQAYWILESGIPSLKGVLLDSVFFYGSGCNSEEKNGRIAGAVSRFLKTGSIFVGSDLLGSARALCQREPGIVCIMGTGSNSCYYDGEKIVSNVAPLGYILGDEGGGAVLGKKLVSAVLKNQVSEEVIKRFRAEYTYSRAEILENVYVMPFPNRFLGSFAKFITANIELPDLQEIVRSSFNEFIVRNVLQYPEAKKYPVHFSGNIAFHLKTFIEELLLKNNLVPGKIIPYPIPELVRYHLSVLK